MRNNKDWRQATSKYKVENLIWKEARILLSRKYK